MNREELEKIIKGALYLFCLRDYYLIVNQLYEVTMAHKIARYLELFFPEFDVDIEYNKMFDRETEETVTKKMGRQTGKTGVRPDIIIHKRGPDKNLLAIELKKRHNDKNRKEDEEELIILTTKIIKQFSYDFGLFIDIGDKLGEFGKFWFTWYQDGKKLNGEPQEIKI